MNYLCLQSIMGIFMIIVTTFAHTDAHLKGWEALDLVRYEIADANVYMEKGLESLLPTVEECLLSDQQPHYLFQDPNRIDAVLETINQVMGIIKPNLEEQRQIVGELMQASNFLIDPLYLVRQTTTKDLLRAGKLLPGFTYDPNEDAAICHNQFASSSESPRSALPFTIPLPEDPNSDDITSALETVHIAKLNAGIIIHEVAEVTLIKHIRPTDPYCRWFTDGFANLISFLVLKKHAGPAVAQDFIDGFDPATFSHLEKQVNLRYWLDLNLALMGNDTSVKELADLNHARYRYATLEAKRIVEKYGIKIIARILEQLSKQESRGGNDVLKVIQGVTGEDMELRMARYQSFTSKAEGIQTYQKALQQAKMQEDLLKTLMNLQYLYELDNPELGNKAEQFRVGPRQVLLCQQHSL